MYESAVFVHSSKFIKDFKGLCRLIRWNVPLQFIESSDNLLD